jgi:hypothetical protein
VLALIGGRSYDVKRGLDRRRKSSGSPARRSNPSRYTPPR